MKTKTPIAALLGGILLLCGAQSHAAINWTYGGNSTSGTPGNTIASTAGGVTATAQAWSNTNNGTLPGLRRMYGQHQLVPLRRATNWKPPTWRSIRAAWG